MEQHSAETAASSSDEPAPPLQRSYRERLCRLYRVYAPERLSNVESALFAYHGREEEMMKVATAKYGPEPTDLFYDLFLASRLPSSTSQENISDNNNTAAGGGGSKELRSPYSERLMWLFLTYCPDKLLLFDDVLYAYRSDPQQMINDFVMEFGPEPQVDYRKQRLKRFYEYYCPEKVSSADQILLAYASEPEEKLFDDLKRKYGPEPSPFCAGTSEADKERLQKVQRGRDAAALTEHSDEQLDPVVLSRDQSEAFTKSRLVEFYKYYCPQKLPFVDSILETYKMHPRGVRQLFFLLEEKYGPEPCKLASSSPPLAEGNSDTVSKISGSDRYSALSDVNTMLSPRNFNHHNLPIFGASGEPLGSTSTHPLDTTIPSPPIHVRPEDLGQLSDRLFRMVLFYDASRLADFYSVMPFLTAVDAAQQLQVWTQYHGPEPSETALMDVHRLISSKEAAEAVVRRVHHTTTTTTTALNPSSNSRGGGASLFPSSSASPLLQAQISFQRDVGDSSTSLPSSYGGHRSGGAGSGALALSVASSSQSPERQQHGAGGGAFAEDDVVVPPASLVATPIIIDNALLSTSRHNVLMVTVTQPNGETSTSTGRAVVTGSALEASTTSVATSGEDAVTAMMAPPVAAAPPPHHRQQAAAPPRPRRQLSISITSPFPYAIYLAALKAGSEKMFMSWWRYNHLADGVDEDDDAAQEAAPASLEELMVAVHSGSHHSVSVMSSVSDGLGGERSVQQQQQQMPMLEGSRSFSTPLCTWRHRAESALLQIRVMAVAGIATAEVVPEELRSQNLADVVEFVLPYWIEQSEEVKQFLQNATSSFNDSDERHHRDDNGNSNRILEDLLFDSLVTSGDSRVQSLLTSCVKQHLKLPGHGWNENQGSASAAPAISAISNIGVVMSQQLAAQALRYLVSIDALQESERKHRYLGGVGVGTNADHAAQPLLLPSIVEEEERAWRQIRRKFVDGVLDIVRLDHLFRLMHAEAMLRDGVLTAEDFQRSGILLSWSRCMYLSNVVPEGSPWKWGAHDSELSSSLSGGASLTTATAGKKKEMPPQHIAAAIWGERDQLSNIVDAQWNVFTKPIFDAVPGSSSNVSKLQLQLRTPRPSSAALVAASKKAGNPLLASSPTETAKVKQRVLSHAKLAATPTAQLYDATAHLKSDPRVERFRSRQATTIAQQIAASSPPRPRYESPVRRKVAVDAAEDASVLLRDAYAPVRFNKTLRSGRPQGEAKPNTRAANVDGVSTPRRTVASGKEVSSKPAISTPTSNRKNNHADAVATTTTTTVSPHHITSHAPPHIHTVARGHFSQYSNFSVVV